nr:hypothetical protein [Tanacetum cinerariifolium]
MGYEKPSTKLTFYKAFFSSQWKFLIHTILQSMSAKRTSWNEFSSAMASAVIYLSTESICQHEEDGKRILEAETPLFEGVLVGVFEEEGDADEQVQDNVKDTTAQEADDAAQGADTVVQGDDEALDACAALTRQVEHLEYDKVAQALEITKLKRKVKKLEKGNKVKVLKLRRLQKVGTSQIIDTSEDTVMEDASNQGKMIDDLDKDYEDEPAELQEVVDVVTTAKLITEVVTAASESVTAVSTTIAIAEPQVPAATIIVAPLRVVVASTRIRKRVVIRDPKKESTTIIPVDTKSKDKGKGIMVEEPKPLKKKQQFEMNEEYARKLHEEINKDIDWKVAIDHFNQKAKEDPFNVAGFRLDYFKGMSYDDIRPIFKAKFNANIAFFLKSKEQLHEEENREIESINVTPAQKAAKRRKLNEEVEDLKRHLEIVPDEDDDVYTEATLLARKVPVVDYEIIYLNNKPHYKIIRADGTH